MTPSWLLPLLQSPAGHPVHPEDGRLVDRIDGTAYEILNNVADLRPKQPEVPEFNYHSHYQIDAELFDYFEEHSGEHAHEERRVHETVMSYVPGSAQTILDVGCGGAWVAEHYLKHGKYVCSMDISTNNIEEAVRRFPSENHAGLAADVFHLPIKENSFDAIIASEVIEHVIDPRQFVHSLFRALKPGGRLVISTPYKELLRYVLCIHCNQKTPIHAHIHSFDEARLLSFAPNGSTTQWKAFGNKALFHLRTHPIMKHLPFNLWLGVDSIANKAIDKRAHIVVAYEK